MRNLIQMRSMMARDIMTPRTVVLAAPEKATAGEFLASHEEGFRFSRIPVYREDIDDMTGYVLRDEVLAAVAEGRPGVGLLELRRDVKTVPETQRRFKPLLTRPPPATPCFSTRVSSPVRGIAISILWVRPLW